MPKQLTADEWNDWLLHPITKAFHQFVRARLNGLKTRWAEGGFTSQDSHASITANAGAVGAAKMLDDFLTLELEDINGELSE